MCRIRFLSHLARVRCIRAQSSQTNTLLQSMCSHPPHSASTSALPHTDPADGAYTFRKPETRKVRSVGLTNRPPAPTASTYSLSKTEFLRQIRLRSLGRQLHNKNLGGSLVLLSTRSPPPACSLLSRSSRELPLPRLFFLSPLQTAPYYLQNSPRDHMRRTHLMCKGIKRIRQDQALVEIPPRLQQQA